VLPVRGLGAAAAIGGVGYVGCRAVVTDELVLDTASAAACAARTPGCSRRRRPNVVFDVTATAYLGRTRDHGPM